MHGLPFEGGRPANRAEQFVLLPEHSAIAAIKLDPISQPIGNRGVATLLPEWLRTSIGMIVEDDEVTGLFIFRCSLGIEEVDVGLAKAAVRHQVQELFYRRL